MLRQKFLQREFCYDGTLSKYFDFMPVDFRNISKENFSNWVFSPPTLILLPFGGFNGIYRNPISNLQPMRIIPKL